MKLKKLIKRLNKAADYRRQTSFIDEVNTPIDYMQSDKITDKIDELVDFLQQYMVSVEPVRRVRSNNEEPPFSRV